MLFSFANLLILWNLYLTDKSIKKTLLYFVNINKFCLFNPVTVSPGCPARFTEAWPYSLKAAGLNLSTWNFADSMHFLNQC